MFCSLYYSTRRICSSFDVVVWYLQAQIKDMKMKYGQKEADAACVLRDNKYLTDTLLKLEQKITETEKKAGTFTSDKDPLVSADTFPFQNKPTLAVNALFTLSNTQI